MSTPINVKESPSDFFRKYLDILDEAVRVGTTTNGYFHRPENQDERDELAQKVKQTRKYTRDMMAYATDPSASDQGDEKLAAQHQPFTKGAASAQTYNYMNAQNNPNATGPMAGATGMQMARSSGSKNSGQQIAAIQTKNNPQIGGIGKTSRWDGRQKPGTNEPVTRAGKVNRPQKPTLPGF